MVLMCVCVEMSFCSPLPIYRYSRREKEIAETRESLAKTENLLLKQLLESTQRELSQAQEAVQLLSETTARRAATAEQHAALIQKVCGIGRTK